MRKRRRLWQAGPGVALAAILTVVAVVVLGGGVATERTVPVVRAQPTASLEGIVAAVGPPTVMVPQYSDQVPRPTAAQRAASEAHMEMAARAWAARGATVPRSSSVGPVGPPPGSETMVPPASGPGPAADDSFKVFWRSTLNPGAGGLASSPINEPAVAQAGKYVFYTWNWGAARSKTAAKGRTPWLYINPYADMADFCCDQDTIYDKGRDIFLWYRQAVVVGSENRVLLGVSTNGGASFCTYEFRPSNLGLANRWFDYPRLALSNNYLYVATNLFVTGGGFDRHILFRWPLTPLSQCAGFGYLWWGFTDGWTPAPVENAREIMYLGDQIAAVPTVNTFRVYWQVEDSGTLFWVDRAIAPFSFTNRDASCPVLGGFNPCLRADMRVVGGVLARNTPSPATLAAAGVGQIDFYWNVKAGGGFPLPYTESAGFDEATLTYVGAGNRKLVWNPGTTWFWTAAGANDRGHVALSMLRFTAGANPMHDVAIDDDYNGSPPGWQVFNVAASTGQWTANSSGDYLRARMHAPQGVQWIVTGYTRDAGAGAYLPQYVVVERERDQRGSNRFNKK